MKKINKNVLKEYDSIVDNLAKVFVEKYFFKDYVFNDDYYWIGSQDEDRDVLAVGDYFFSIDDIINFIRYKYTSKKMFEYYDYKLDKDMQDTKDKVLINIKNWKNL